jgi:hypothetical protein
VPDSYKFGFHYHACFASIAIKIAGISAGMGLDSGLRKFTFDPGWLSNSD